MKKILLFICLFFVFSVRADEIIVRHRQITLRDTIGSERGIENIQRGVRLKVIKRVKNWYHVVSPEGNVGWVYEDFVNLDRENLELFKTPLQKSPICIS